jgi:hypothetical protein
MKWQMRYRPYTERGVRAAQRGQVGRGANHNLFPTLHIEYIYKGQFYVELTGLTCNL